MLPADPEHVNPEHLNPEHVNIERLNVEHPEYRIGYVTKMYPRFSETFIVNEIRALESQGAHIEILSLRPPVDARFHAALAQVRAPVRYLPRPYKQAELWVGLRRAEEVLDLAATLPDLLAVGPADAAQAVELALYVRERGIDHLHAHFGSVATTVARLAARLAGVRYTFTAHAKDIFHEEVDPADLARKLADAAAVVTVSDFNARHLRQTFGPAAARVRRIYNGLDLEEYPYTAPTDRPAVLVGVGRLVEKKGFRYLVEAVDLLVRQGRALRLDLVGSGPEEEPLRRQIAELGLADHVRLVGPLPQHDVRRVVAGSAALVAPCVVGADGNRDGLPTVVLEGMALGTPVVATPVTGIPEAVADGETGLLVPEADPTALAAAIGRLLDDADLATSLAQAARTRVQRDFDIRRNTAQLLEVLRQESRAVAA